MTFLKFINSLDSTKNTSNAILTQTVKLIHKQICKYLTNCLNDCLKKKIPNELKIANMSPIFKRKYPLDITTDRAISILSTILKIFERILFNQLQRFSYKFL